MKAIKRILLFLIIVAAAYKLQRDFIGFEIDDDYYAAGSQWLDTTMSQVSIFDLLQQN